MSSSRALVISSSSAASGSAPGCAYSTTLSRMIIRVGMDEMVKAAAISGSASVSTLPNTAPGCRPDAFSNTGPNIRHGPHQAAQKSTRTRPPPVTVGGWHWLQTIVLINPLIYVNEGMRAAFTDIPHLHLYVIYPVVAGFGAVFLAIGLRNFRRRVLS